MLVRQSHALILVHGLNEPVLEPGPTAQIYFFNTSTGESTYVRPLPALPAPASKKEKPKHKIPIPGTDWLRVTTNQGNVFYTNKTKKESVWTVPEEIKDAVELLNNQEEDEKVRSGKQAQEKPRRDADAEEEREIERVRMEVQEVVKRKAEDISPSDEVISKKLRVGDQVENKAEEVQGIEDGEESEEEDWQREAAAQLAKEAEEEEEKRKEEEAEEARKTKESAPQLLIPDRVDLSIEEGKALFKVCLQCSIHPPVPLKISYIVCTDATSREGRKSFTSMGHLSPTLYLGSTLCAPSFRFCASRSL
jgi:hypothetical protein